MGNPQWRYLDSVSEREKCYVNVYITIGNVGHSAVGMPSRFARIQTGLTRKPTSIGLQDFKIARLQHCHFQQF